MPGPGSAWVLDNVNHGVSVPVNSPARKLIEIGGQVRLAQVLEHAL